MMGSGRKNVAEFDPLLAAPHSNGHLFKHPPFSIELAEHKRLSNGYFLPCRNKQDLVKGVI